MDSLKMRLCLGDMVVPLCPGEAWFADLHEVTTGMEEKKMDWLFLNLATSSQPYTMWWLEQGMDLPYRWWKAHSGGLPLLKEIIQHIKIQNLPRANRGACPGSQISSWPSRFGVRSSS